MPGLISTSQLKIGFGFPPSLMQANVSSEFSLTGTKLFPASRRRESMSKYGGFGRSSNQITRGKRREEMIFIRVNAS